MTVGRRVVEGLETFSGNSSYIGEGKSIFARTLGYQYPIFLFVSVLSRFHDSALRPGADSYCFYTSPPLRLWNSSPRYLSDQFFLIVTSNRIDDAGMDPPRSSSF